MSEQKKDLYKIEEHQNRVFGINIKRVIPFIEMWWGSFILSGILIIAGTVLFFVKGGFNLGIDFKGGIKVEAKIDNPETSIEKVRAVFASKKIEADINTVGQASEMHYMITLPVVANTAVGDEISMIKENLEGKFGKDKVTTLGSESVDAKMGADFARKALNLVLVTALLIMIYVIFRFDLAFGAGAIGALFHDVLMMLVFAIFFNVPIDITVIAAIMTIIGYSVNDTIVIFDRIRELFKNNPNEDVKYVMDKSITQTLSRTIITALMVFFVVLALYIWGGVVLKNFSFLMLVGVIDGCYSSIFIAAPITYLVKKSLDKKGKKHYEKAVPAEGK